MTRSANRADNVTGVFTRRDAQRIANAVVHYEKGTRREKPVEFARNFPAGGRVRLCKTKEEWAVGSLADLEVWEAGTPPSESKSDPAETIEKCVNKVRTVKADTFVLVAKAGNGSWYLIEVCKADDSDCTDMVGNTPVDKIKGFSMGKRQALGHSSGCLEWIDIEDCPTP